jgi:hypothetical protein
MKRLEEVLDRLYASEINLSISCFWDNDIDVKLGDEMNGFASIANVKDGGGRCRVAGPRGATALPRLCLRPQGRIGQ